MRRKRGATAEPVPMAGNGLLNRRVLLGTAAGAVAALANRSAMADGELKIEPWMRDVGSPFTGYGQPSQYEAKVVRIATTAPAAVPSRTRRLSRPFPAIGTGSAVASRFLRTGGYSTITWPYIHGCGVQM